MKSSRYEYFQSYSPKILIEYFHLFVTLFRSSWSFEQN